jgi:hypothetical protein
MRRRMGGPPCPSESFRPVAWVVDDPTELPEGAELELVVVGNDDLDDEDMTNYLPGGPVTGVQRNIAGLWA